ncbi:MAG: tRNA adenosine(34) deaminase TadA [Planctomycetia bacterium]|nr:tRNA adenosine(34) deaminase TadA [Planctomycetia bacterium]
MSQEFFASANTDEYFMRLALDEAQLAFDEDEVPVGAVLVHRGQVIARDHNRREQRKDATAHAEMLVIQAAAAFFASWRMEETTLYVTLEPCPMCAGAIVQSRVDRVVYGTTDPKGGAVETLFRLLDDSRLNHRCEIESGVLLEPCRAILQDFFRRRR